MNLRRVVIPTAILATAFAISALVVWVLSAWTRAAPQPSADELCRYALIDRAAGRACLAESNCAKKWDSELFRMNIQNAEDDIEQYCKEKRS